MIPALGLVIAFALGVDARRLLLLAAAVHLPMVVAALVVLHWYRSRPDDSSRPSLFCEGVASELRAGATLRDALFTAATSVGLRPRPSLDPQSASMAGVAAQIAEWFPSVGQELSLTVMAAARSGSDTAALFDEIGSLALAQAELRREVRVATAPGRATALVLVGAPLFYLVNQAGSGGLADLVATSEQRVVLVVGLGLFATGLVAACLVLWRASR